MSATWNPNLIHEEAEVISTKAQAKYNYACATGQRVGLHGLTFFAPNINIVRDPRWGGGQETYGGIRISHREWQLHLSEACRETTPNISRL